jgi:AcrR family transcriptional regulator
MILKVAYKLIYQYLFLDSLDKPFPLVILSVYSMSRYSMNKREQQKLETKEKIIRVATFLFSSTGFRDVSTLDIAHGAMVSHGTIFAHFKSREELVYTVIEIFGSNLLSRMNSLVEKDSTLEQVVALHLSSLMDTEDFYRELIIEAPNLPPKARTGFIAIQSGISDIICKSVDKTINLQLNHLFSTWSSLLHYYLSNRDIFAPNASILEKRGKEITRLFMELVSKNKITEEE